MSRGGSVLSSSALLVVGGHVWISIHSFLWDHTWLQEKTCLTFCCLANSPCSFLPSQTSVSIFQEISYLHNINTYTVEKLFSFPILKNASKWICAFVLHTKTGWRGILQQVNKPESTWCCFTVSLWCMISGDVIIKNIQQIFHNVTQAILSYTVCNYLYFQISKLTHTLPNVAPYMFLCFSSRTNHFQLKW